MVKQLYTNKIKYLLNAKIVSLKHKKRKGKHQYFIHYIIFQIYY